MDADDLEVDICMARFELLMDRRCVGAGSFSFVAIDISDSLLSPMLRFSSIATMSFCFSDSI